MNTSVHMSGSLGGSRRPRQATPTGQASSMAWIRVRPGAPRTLRAAVGLMYAAAALELAAMITLVLTAGSVRSAVLGSHPALWHTALLKLTIDEITAPVVVVLLLWLAWANGRGYEWARVVLVALAALVTLGLIQGLAGHSLRYARADLIAGAIQWLVLLAAAVLVLTKRSRAYHRPEPGQR